MLRAILLVTAVALLLACTTAFAHFTDGNHLVAWMREKDKMSAGDPQANWLEAYRYWGFVTGVYDTIGMQLCPPTGLTIGQAEAWE